MKPNFQKNPMPYVHALKRRTVHTHTSPKASPLPIPFFCSLCCIFLPFSILTFLLSLLLSFHSHSGSLPPLSDTVTALSTFSLICSLVHGCYFCSPSVSYITPSPLPLIFLFHFPLHYTPHSLSFPIES